MTRILRHIGRGRPLPNRYDHLDRRVQKITPAATHTFFYDGCKTWGQTLRLRRQFT